MPPDPRAAQVLKTLRDKVRIEAEVLADGGIPDILITTEIVGNEMLMLGGRSSGASAAASEPRERPDMAEPVGGRAEPTARGGNDFDDDIPF